MGAVKIRLAPHEMKETSGSLEEGRVFRGRAKGGVSVAEESPALESPSLNIIGLRVDEALPLVDKLLDQAVLHDCRQVDIIHGIGTGRLQQAVRQHLRQHSHGKGISSRGINPGGPRRYRGGDQGINRRVDWMCSLAWFTSQIDTCLNLKQKDLIGYLAVGDNNNLFINEF